MTTLDSALSRSPPGASKAAHYPLAALVDAVAEAASSALGPEPYRPGPSQPLLPGFDHLQQQLSLAPAKAAYSTTVAVKTSPVLPGFINYAAAADKYPHGPSTASPPPKPAAGLPSIFPCRRPGQFPAPHPSSSLLSDTSSSSASSSSSSASLSSSPTSSSSSHPFPFLTGAHPALAFQHGGNQYSRSSPPPLPPSTSLPMSHSLSSASPPRHHHHHHHSAFSAFSPSGATAASVSASASSLPLQGGPSFYEGGVLTTLPPGVSSMTEEQKEMLYQKSLQSPEMTQVQLAHWAKHKFNLCYVPNQPSISNLLSKYRRKRPSCEQSASHRGGKKCLLTEAQRNAIYLQKLQNPGLTQADLAKWAQQTFNLPRPPHQPTISLILTKRRRLNSLSLLSTL